MNNLPTLLVVALYLALGLFFVRLVVSVWVTSLVARTDQMETTLTLKRALLYSLGFREEDTSD